MAPWGFLATAAACVVFPHHRGIILVVSAVGSVVRGGQQQQQQQQRRRRRELSSLSLAGSHGKDLDALDERTRKALEAAEAALPGAPVTLEWSRVTCSLVDKKKGHKAKKLLDEQEGVARPGRLLAIMGPSGAGKTTLLNTLAGQLPAGGSGGSRTELRGVITANGVPLGLSPHKQAYVRQEDMFFSHLTVRETLAFAAKLQLPGDMAEEDKDRSVDDLLKRMGLAKCASTIVGSSKVRGISGGEKKRLSVACELLGNPSLIFLDEPTTGLDAFQAHAVMTALHDLAEKEGKTVVCSIHQPRGSVYDMFDDVILLAEGQLIYSGPAGDYALDYFKRLGYEAPPHANPAEFLSDLVGVDHSASDKETAAAHDRIANLVHAFRETVRSIPSAPPAVLPSPSPSENGAHTNGVAHGKEEEEEGESKALTTTTAKGKPQGAGVVKKLLLLLSRAWKQTTRDKTTNFVRAAMNVTSALIFGSVFWRMGLSQTSIQDRMGLLQVAAINTAMASITKTLNVFPNERQIVQREMSKGAYGAGEYFASKLAAELPIGAMFPALFSVVMYPMTGLHKSLSRFGRFLLMTTVESFTSSAMGLTVGCIAPSTEAAMALGPSVMTLFIVFGGYYVNPDNTPLVFRWIPRVSLIRWAFEGLCVNEFKGLTFEATKPSDVRTGEQVLDRLSFDESSGGSLRASITSEAKILSFWYWASLYLLQRKQPKYAALLPPPAVEAEARGQAKVEEIVAAGQGTTVVIQPV